MLEISMKNTKVKILTKAKYCTTNFEKTEFPLPMQPPYQTTKKWKSEILKSDQCPGSFSAKACKNYQYTMLILSRKISRNADS